MLCHKAVEAALRCFRQRIIGRPLVGKFRMPADEGINRAYSNDARAGNCLNELSVCHSRFPNWNKRCLLSFPHTSLL